MECLDLQFLDSWLIAGLPGELLHNVVYLPSLSSQLPPPRVQERRVDGFAARHRERPGALATPASQGPCLLCYLISAPPSHSCSQIPTSPFLPPLFGYLGGVVPGLETGRQLLRKAGDLKGWPVFCCLVRMRASDNPGAGP